MTTACGGHGEAVTSQIEKGLGVKVELTEFPLPGKRASLLREVFETGKSSNAQLEELLEIVRQAEVVVMFAKPWDGSNPGQRHRMLFLVNATLDCSDESFAGYQEDLQTIRA